MEEDGLDLEELRRERERQTELLRQLGLLDDEEPEQTETAEEAEPDRITLAEFDQVQEQIERRGQQEAKASASARLDLFIYTPAMNTQSSQKGEPLRLSSGRVFHDYGNRVFAAGSIEHPEEAAADLLEAAQRKGWESYTIKAGASFSQVVREAFRLAIKAGLPLVPDFGPSGQGAIAIAVSKELKDQGLGEKAREFMRMVLGERDDMRATLVARLKARVQSK